MELMNTLLAMAKELGILDFDILSAAKGTWSHSKTKRTMLQ
jgi:hypothetical protein